MQPQLDLKIPALYPIGLSVLRKNLQKDIQKRQKTTIVKAMSQKHLIREDVKMTESEKEKWMTNIVNLADCVAASVGKVLVQ